MTHINRHSFAFFCLLLLYVSCEKNSIECRQRGSYDWLLTEKENRVIDYDILDWPFFELNNDGVYSHMRLCYDYMDKMAKDAPSIVTKYNPLAIGDYFEEGILIRPLPEIRRKLLETGFSEWPVYYQGVTGAGEFILGDSCVNLQATPAYKTYIYKISNNARGQHHVNKRVVYIQAGIHSAEVMGQISTCLFVNSLLSDNSISKALLANYDFWIIPCLEGYGGMHGNSLSAVNVNPNRNYNTPWWKYDEGVVNSGLAPGDHFSVSLSMSMIDFLNPDVAIDVHTLNDEVTLQSKYSAVGVFRYYPEELYGISSRFIEYVSDVLQQRYSTLFTKKPVFEVTCQIPNGARCFDYFYVKGVGVFATVEVNNVVESNSETTNSSEALSEAAFWLKNAVYALCRYDLESVQ